MTDLQDCDSSETQRSLMGPGYKPSNVFKCLPTTEVFYVFVLMKFQSMI